MAQTSDNDVLYHVKNWVATITLNRPNSSNALTDSLRSQIVAAIHRAEQDPNVRVVVLTGAGKNFCAGADLKEIPDEKRKRSVYETGIHSYRPMIEAILHSSKIIIGAINGAAAGAGSGVALACDLRVMADTASILQAFINIALVPDAGVSYFLVRHIGYTRALEIALDGKPVTAKRCLDLGLTNKVVPNADLLASAQSWAEQLAERSEPALRLTKSVMRHAGNVCASDTIEYEFRLQQFLVKQSDNVESVQAFFEKRKPKLGNFNPNIPAGVLASKL